MMFVVLSFWKNFQLLILLIAGFEDSARKEKIQFVIQFASPFYSVYCKICVSDISDSAKYGVFFRPIV